MGMETGCLEVVVNRRNSTLYRCAMLLTGALAVGCLILSFFIHFAFLVGVAGFVLLSRLCWWHILTDWEYVYVENELRVTEILQKEKRAKTAVYDFAKLDVLGPVKSSRVEARRRQGATCTDYTGVNGQDPSRCCVLVLMDGSELLLDLGGEYGERMLQQMRHDQPSKVFLQ